MKDAKVRANHMADPTGKVRKITDMSLKQVNDHLSLISRATKWNSKLLISLYQKRAELMGEPIEPRKNQRKMMEWVGVKQFKPESEQRYKQLILLCLSMFENNTADLKVIEAILRQVLEE